MRHIAVMALAVGSMLYNAGIAGAQCSELKTTEKSGTGNNELCPGNDPGYDIFYQRDWDAHTETACKNGGWKRQWNAPDVLRGTATGECGNTPANTPPICEGNVTGPYDLGVNVQTSKHKVRAEQHDATWTGFGCNYPASVYVDLELETEECNGEFCCAFNVDSEYRGLQGDFNWAACTCDFGTPIIVDVEGDGFQLTSFKDGVSFRPDVERTSSTNVVDCERDRRCVFGY